jgi:hypothetical protein
MGSALPEPAVNHPALAASGLETPFKAVVRANWQRRKCSARFKDAAGKLLSALFEHVGSVHKGRLCECSLLNALTTVAASKPDEMRKMIHKVNDSDYQISLPGYSPVTVTVPGESEIDDCLARPDCFLPGIIDRVCVRLKPLAHKSAGKSDKKVLAELIL